jgi:hypothetical protein
MARIFISYAHEDQAAAKRLVDALAREGLEAWWDHAIPPGRSWDEVIGQRIGAADVVVVIWSQRSVASNFVKEEAQLAYDAGKLLPVKVEEVEPPVGFRRVHAANLVGWRGDGQHLQWRALVEEVRQRLGAPTSHQAPPAARIARPPWRLIAAGVIAVSAVALGVWLRPWAQLAAPIAEAPMLESATEAQAPSDMRADNQAAQAGEPERPEPQSQAREREGRVAVNATTGERTRWSDGAWRQVSAPLTDAVWLGYGEFANGNTQRVRFRFSSDRSAQIALGELDFQAFDYTWRLDGDELEVAASGLETWRGTIQDAVIRGDYYNAQGERRGSFQLTRQ